MTTFIVIILSVKKALALIVALTFVVVFGATAILTLLYSGYFLFGLGMNINNKFEGITFIPTDFDRAVQGTITGYSYTYVIPDVSNELRVLVTRGDALLGVNTSDGFKKTKVVSTPFIGPNIAKQVLGCNLITKICYILQIKYFDFTDYQPINILSYQYDVQKFSTIYTFNQELPERVVFIDKIPNQAVIASKLNYKSSAPGFMQTTKYFVLNIDNGSVSIITGYELNQKEKNVRISFDANDNDFIFKGTKNGMSTGDEIFDIVDYVYNMGGTFSGTDSKISIYKNKNLVTSFNCHNCMARYLGKNFNDIFLLIMEDLKIEIGKVSLKHL